MQEQRNENELAENIQARRNIRKNAKTFEEGRQAAKRLNITPSEKEITWEWSKIKERAHGENGVRMIYLKAALAHFQAKVAKVVQALFNTPAEHWNDIVKMGLIILLHKKGVKDNPNNFRELCLLWMASRILARVLTSRLRVKHQRRVKIMEL